MSTPPPEQAGGVTSTRSAVEHAVSGALENLIPMVAKALRRRLAHQRATERETRTAWQAALQRYRPVEPATRSSLLDGLHDIVDTHVRAARAPATCCNLFILLFDPEDSSIVFWAPESTSKFGHPYTTLEGFARDHPGDIGDISRVRMPLDRLTSGILGPSFRDARCRHIGRLDPRSRSHALFDVVAGFMSVLCIPVPRRPGALLQRALRNGEELSGAIVVSSPSPDFFSPRRRRDRTQRGVVREVLQLLNDFHIADHTRILQTAFLQGRADARDLMSQVVHGAVTRGSLAIPLLRGCLASGTLAPAQARAISDAALLVQALLGSLEYTRLTRRERHERIRESIEPFEMSTYLEGIGTVFSGLVAPRGIDFEFSAEAASVLASRQDLALALYTLLENAVDAASSAPGDGKVRSIGLRGTCFTEPAGYRVEVVNTGPPIAEAVLDEFEAAIRDGRNRIHPRKSRGSGLGLVLASEILRAHGVYLGKSSFSCFRAGSGTRVTFTLPC